MPGPRSLHPPIDTPLPDVRTERLELRRFHPEDLDGLATVFAKPEVWRFPYGRGLDRDDPAAWGKGYASEGARAALRESFTTLGLDEVCSVPQADNPASSRVCERIGMRLARAVSIPANARRGALEGVLYEMTRAEWLGSKTPARPPG